MIGNEFCIDMFGKDFKEIKRNYMWGKYVFFVKKNGKQVLISF